MSEVPERTFSAQTSSLICSFHLLATCGRSALMLSLLFLCSAVADALKFDGGISLSQLPTPALLVDVDELPGGVEALPHAAASDERRCATLCSFTRV